MKSISHWIEHRRGRLGPVIVFGLLGVLMGTSVQSEDVSHERGRIKINGLEETSGVAASRQNANVLWVHNDGDSGRLFAVSTSGKFAAMLTARARIHDLEEICLGIGPKAGVDYLYLGDIGDNSERRPEVQVVRFPEPKLSAERGDELTIDEPEVFRFTYPDGAHDAEAMFVDPTARELCIVTKERKKARLFTVALEKLDVQRVVDLTMVATIDVEEASAGAISWDGRRILLRREKEGWLWERQPGETVAVAVSRKPERVPVHGKDQAGNGESICFSPDGNSYFTVSEGKKQPIYEFDVPRAEKSKGK